MMSIAVRLATDSSEAEDPSDFAGQIHRAVQTAAHYLPTQGPIETFIHHNTLHAFEGLPFHEAVVEAGKKFNAHGYLEEHEFRVLHRAGRITDRDLAEAMAKRRIPWPNNTASPFDEPIGVLRAAFLHDLDPHPAAHVRWCLAEEHDQWPDDRRDLWSASLDAVRRAANPGPRALLSEWEPLLRQLGFVSHRDVLLALTGHDIAIEVDAWIIRVCAEHLDEGIATDPRPDRHLPLYCAWLRYARPGARALRGLPRDVALPATAVDAVILALEQLQVPKPRWASYIARVLLHLPGWAGMIHWRETHPEYRPQLPPVELIDYLAIRLLGEWAELNIAVRRFWGLKDAKAMVGYLEQRPCEVAVRRALFAGTLDAHHGQLARQAKASPRHQQETRFRAVVDSIARDSETPLVQLAWQLFRASTALGISAYELRGAENQQIATLIGYLAEFSIDYRLPIWQDAYEIGYRNTILEALWHNRKVSVDVPGATVEFQVVCCFDDREEGFRRHIEEIAPHCETYGAAGFFNLPIAFRGRHEDEFSSLCPLGVTPVHRVIEVASHKHQDLAQQFDRGRSWVRQWRSHWRDILGHGWASLLGAYAVAFVAWLRLVGEIMFPRQFQRLTRPVLEAVMPPHATDLIPEQASEDATNNVGGFSLAEQVDRLTAFLQNIGLTDNFAPLVVLLAHGSASINNPHLSAYDCGACGGRHGGPNSRLMARIANSPAVRAGLRTNGIDIPDRVHFIGGEHNTANEDVILTDVEHIPTGHRKRFDEFLRIINRTREASAAERCRKFAHAPAYPSPREALVHVQERSLDPSQPRPELGHVTVACGIIGRRKLSRGLFLDRRAFLISYDPTIDPDGSILERLLLAAAPVGGGIALEYYFSRVDNLRYGAGTKLPHNVVSLIGVMDGGHSDLRTGLPKQMIEIHEPMRLQLFIEARIEVIASVCDRAPTVKKLVDNGWVLINTIHPETGEVAIYGPGVGFSTWTPRNLRVPEVSSSAAWYRGRMEFLPPAHIRASSTGVITRDT